MKYLHLKVAKRLCREQWAWYVVNLDKYKSNWPKMEVIEAEYGWIDGDCFYCHYTFQHAKPDTEKAYCERRCPFYLKYGHLCMDGPYPYDTDPVGFNTMVQAIK